MYVYLIVSERDPKRTYIGLTEDFERRISQHNVGDVTSTFRFRPWRCEVLIWIADTAKAEMFERYLKSGSGRTFAKRHFW